MKKIEFEVKNATFSGIYNKAVFIESKSRYNQRLSFRFNEKTKIGRSYFVETISNDEMLQFR